MRIGDNRCNLYISRYIRSGLVATFLRTVSYTSGSCGVKNAAESPSPKSVRAIRKITRAPRNFAKEGHFRGVGANVPPSRLERKRGGLTKPTKIDDSKSTGPY